MAARSAIAAAAASAAYFGAFLKRGFVMVLSPSGWLMPKNYIAPPPPICNFYLPPCEFSALSWDYARGSVP